MFASTGQPIECWQGEAAPHQQELLDLVRAQPGHERQEERHPVQDVIGAPRLVQAAAQTKLLQQPGRATTCQDARGATLTANTAAAPCGLPCSGLAKLRRPSNSCAALCCMHLSSKLSAPEHV